MAKKIGMMNGSQNKLLKMNYYKLLNSRFLLYFILLLSLADLFYFALEHDYLFCGIFILIGFLTSFFSKNMMVILAIAMTLTNVLRFGKGVRVNEGMEDDAKIEDDLEEKTEVPETATDVNVDDLNVKADADKPKKASSSANTDDLIAGLDDQTANLIQQQKTLMQNMENLTPLLQKAEGFMEKFQSLKQ